MTNPQNDLLNQSMKRSDNKINDFFDFVGGKISDGVEWIADKFGIDTPLDTKEEIDKKKEERTKEKNETLRKWEEMPEEVRKRLINNHKYLTWEKFQQMDETQKIIWIEQTPVKWTGGGQAENINGTKLYINNDGNWTPKKQNVTYYHQEDGRKWQVGYYGTEQEREESRYREQMDFQREQWEYQKAMYEEQKMREDTAYQRAFNDISASGFNPLAGGENSETGSFNGGGYAGPSNYTEHGYADMLNRLSIEQQGRKDIAELAINRDSLMLESQKASSENANAQAEITLAYKQMYADLLKNGIIDKKTAERYAELFLDNLAKTGNNLTKEGQNLDATTENTKQDTENKKSEKEATDYDLEYQRSHGTNLKADGKIQIAETALETANKTAKKADELLQMQALEEQITRELKGVDNPTIKLNYLIDRKAFFITYYGENAYKLAKEKLEYERMEREKRRNRSDYDD